ncbi:MAG TPA: glycosyltransferase family 2 protein [Candidatus Paceibacterota bacterium]
MKNGKKIIAVLPAYNAEKTLKQTLDDIPKDWVDDIILVDDASSDRTVELSRSFGLKTFVHEKNLGYGGNQKTCYKEALKLGADVVVMVHPDHQYDPSNIPQAVLPIALNEADAVFGSRMMIPRQALKGGMPLWKYIANIFLTRFSNFILKTDLTEYHSGFRAYSREILEILPLEKNSDDFVFDMEIIIQLIHNKFRIKEIPIPTRYFKDASSVNFRRSVIYGLSILWTLAKYKLHRRRIITFSLFLKRS